MEIRKTATYTGHRDCIYSLQKSGHANRFFSAGGDGLVVQWDFNTPDTGEVIAKVENSVYAMGYLEEKNWLLIGQNFKGIHAIDLLSKEEKRFIQFTEAAIFDILITDEVIYVATGDGKVHFFDKNLQLTKVLHLSGSSARCLAHNVTTGDLAIGYSDHKIRVIRKDTSVQELTGHTNSVFALVYSPDGTLLYSGGRDAHLKVWDVWEHYQLQTSVVAHMYAIHHIAFSPDAIHFATASMDKSVKIWDAATCRLLKVIDKSRHAGHSTSVNKLLWSPFNSQLISSGDDRTICIWQLN